MSEYIRKDDVLALLKKYRIELPSTYSVGLTTAKNAVKGMPTEDVVPRAEVAREIFAEIERSFMYRTADIYSGDVFIDKVDFAELKKKYGVTES